MNELELVWSQREKGEMRTPRKFIDFVVDGVSLHKMIGRDLVSTLGWFVPEENAKAVQRLLAMEPGDMESGRTSLYVCPECGDLLCGPVGAYIEREGESVIWRDFAYEWPTYDEGDSGMEPLPHLGSFEFAWANYERVLRETLQ